MFTGKKLRNCCEREPEPEWFRPGTLVRLNPQAAAAWRCPQTAVLQAAPPVYAELGFLFYSAGDNPMSSGCHVRPEHVEPVEAPAPRVSFREFL